MQSLSCVVSLHMSLTSLSLIARILYWQDFSHYYDFNGVTSTGLPSVSELLSPVVITTIPPVNHEANESHRMLLSSLATITTTTTTATAATMTTDPSGRDINRGSPLYQFALPTPAQQNIRQLQSDEIGPQVCYVSTLLHWYSVFLLLCMII
jgi:hypothetical protein